MHPKIVMNINTTKKKNKNKTHFNLVKKKLIDEISWHIGITWIINYKKKKNYISPNFIPKYKEKMRKKDKSNFFFLFTFPFLSFLFFSFLPFFPFPLSISFSLFFPHPNGCLLFLFWSPESQPLNYDMPLFFIEQRWCEGFDCHRG